MRILIAEDDTASRLILEAALAALGHEVIAAADGEQAWQLFQAQKVEAIISDREMPRLNGDDLCRRVREGDGGKYIYFIFLTSVSDKVGAAEAIRAGADDYLMKLLNRQELEARLMVASRITELYRELANQQVELERLNGRLFQQARIDGLTQVGNRLKMREDLNILAARVTEQGESFCAVMCDVDHFKPYNDKYGHLQGDDVLKKIASTLVQGCRPNDEIYRFGGEEFLLVVPDQSIEVACAVAGRHRVRIEQLAIPNIGSPTAIVTISTGVASISPSGRPSIKEWLERADRALYPAKQLGRNRVVVAAGV
jgi:two-component system, cell cycle response regulator